MKHNRKSSPDDKFGKINSLKLISLVRSQEVIYNSDADGYSDKNIKEVAWERIYRSLFPRYESLSESHKEEISSNVRRRWKTLRNAIAREVKKNATVEYYIRKKESPVIAELEFLIPHIKSAHCAKLADELGLRDCYGTINQTDEQEYDEDFNDTVDLTEEQLDIKPFLKTDQVYTEMPNGSSTMIPHEALYPNVQLNTMDEGSNGFNGIRNDCRMNATSAWRHVDTVVAAATAAANNSALQNSSSSGSNWRSEYCAVVQCKEGEFMNSTLLCTNPENDENHEDPLNMPQLTRQSKMPSPIIANRKRPRTTQNGTELINGNGNGNEHNINGDAGLNGDTTDIQARILRLLSNLERRENRDSRAEQDAQDEDRMFLLSLVSDLRRVPPAKKMLLKAEIAMAIARAVPP